MRKIFILLTFLFLTYFVKAQTTYPITQNLGSPVTLVKVPVNGGLQAVLVPTPFADTTAANAVSYVKYTAGAMIRTTGDNKFWKRNEAKTAWLAASGSGAISSFTFLTDSSLIICYTDLSCDTISLENNNVFATQNYVDSSITMNVNQGNCNGVSPGGNVVTWSGSGLKFYISAGNFSIQCKNYYGESDSVTLAAADPTNPRFDVIYRDTSGNVGVITGTPSPNPALPQINPAYQIALTYVLVEAGATTPSGITNRLIYDENLQVAGGEWNTLATNVNVFPNQTPVASNLIRSTYWDHVYALGAAYSNTSNISVSSQDVLWFKILFKGFNSYNATQENIIGLGFVQNGVPFIEGAGITYIKHGTNGLDTTNKTNWQTIAVPLSQFLNPYQGHLYTLDSVYSLSINTINSDTVGGGAEFYIDEINLQSGLVQTGVKPGIYVNDVYSTPSALTDTLWKVRNGDTTVVNIYDRNCGIFQPGIVTWDSLLVFSISPSGYRLCCDGIRRTTGQEVRTLSAADVTNGRFDAIILDENGVNVVEGTPSATPDLPQITDCQLLLTYIFIPAGSTTPGNGNNGCGLPGKETIYDETGGSEWTPTASIVTVNFSNTVNPYHFTKAADVGTFSTFGSAVTFTRGSTITLSNYSAIKFFIRLKSNFGGNTYIGARFLNSTTALGTTTAFIQNGQFNFQRTLTGVYQEITIPMSIFLAGASTITVDRLTFFLYGSNADGFYIDYIQLQEGICQPPTTTAGTVTSFSAGNLSPLFTTSVTNATTTPGLNFFQISQNQNLVFASPNGGSGVPTFRALVAADLPAGATGANPTASVGLSAVNGVATTFLRSDGAPALSQSIVPTWTGIHTFNNKVLMLDGRFEYDKGADVAAANDLTLGTDGNLFSITGNTQINAITTANWQAGSQIAFIFTGTPTLKNNTAGGAGTAPMLLAGRVDFTATAGDYIGLQYDGTNWYETNRKLAASGGVYTFTNGLTESPAGTVKLGGTLTGNTTIATGANTLTISTATAAINPVTISSTSGNGLVSNSTTGGAIQGIASGSGVGVYGNSSTGQGGLFSSTSSIGIDASTNNFANNFAAQFTTGAGNGNNNTVLRNLNIRRFANGTPANGIGASISFDIRTVTSNDYATELISKWTEATHPIRTSQFIITGVNSAVTGDIAYFNGNGMVGIGDATASATRLNVVDNAVGAASIVNISSTSTAAASDLQKGLNIALNGANATASQTTYGVYVDNSHSGTTPVNYGIYSTLTNGTTTSAAFKASVTTQLGVDVVGTSGTGVQSVVTTGKAFYGSVTGSNPVFEFTKLSAATASTISIGSLFGQSSGTAAAGFGPTFDMYSEANDNSNPLSVSLRGVNIDATAATFTTSADFYVQNSNTITRRLRIMGVDGVVATGRVQYQQGADVASVAGAIAVGIDGNVFELTGTNAVTLISNLNWQNGSIIHLLFTSTATLTDGTANSGTDIGMELAGNVNFTGTADDVITLVLSEIGGVQRWREVSRAVN